MECRGLKRVESGGDGGVNRWKGSGGGVGWVRRGGGSG